MGDSLSENEQPDIPAHADNVANDSFDYADPLRVSIADAIAGILSIAGIIALLIFTFTRTLLNLFPIVMLVVVLLGINAFNAFFPREAWSLQMAGMSLTVEFSGEMEPSDFWLGMRKIGLWLSLVVAAGFLYALTLFAN